MQYINLSLNEMKKLLKEVKRKIDILHISLHSFFIFNRQEFFNCIRNFSAFRCENSINYIKS